MLRAFTYAPLRHIIRCGYQRYFLRSYTYIIYSYKYTFCTQTHSVQLVCRWLYTQDTLTHTRTAEEKKRFFVEIAAASTSMFTFTVYHRHHRTPTPIQPNRFQVRHASSSSNIVQQHRLAVAAYKNAHIQTRSKAVRPTICTQFAANTERTRTTYWHVPHERVGPVRFPSNVEHIAIHLHSNSYVGRFYAVDAALR